MGRWRVRAARPDQHSVVLVHGELEYLDDFGFQVIEIGVVQLKLASESAIRYPTATLKYVENVVQDLLEGHCNFLPCSGSGAPYPSSLPLGEGIGGRGQS